MRRWSSVSWGRPDRYRVAMGDVGTIADTAINAHRTLHDVIRQENPRQENRVMCGGQRRDTTRQKSGLVADI